MARRVQDTAEARRIHDERRGYVPSATYQHRRSCVGQGLARRAGKVSAVITLADLRDLCVRYVPMKSRHPGSLRYNEFLPGTEDTWWYAHEIGHLLTVPFRNIGLPLFGLGDGWPFGKPDEHKLLCYERAAMSIGCRLMHAVGRPGLTRDEYGYTEERVLTFQDGGRVRQILRRRRCLRLPSTRRGLEQKIVAVVTRAGKCT